MDSGSLRALFAKILNTEVPAALCLRLLPHVSASRLLRNIAGLTDFSEIEQRKHNVELGATHQA